MGLRSELLVELVREVLGPRDGPYEVLKTSPLEEYLTGVLRPAQVETYEAEAMADSLADGGEIGEEDLDEAGILPGVFTPALDPRSRAPSMGLSFQVRTDGGPSRLQACVTWACYFPLNEGQERQWKRYPRCHIFPLQEGTIFLEGECPDGQRRTEVSVHVRLDPFQEKPDVFQVTIQMVNRISPVDQRKSRTEEHLFQPQIRVICEQDVRLETFRSREPRDEEEARLDFLYRDRPVKARGLLVSAVWKEIDPERPASEEGPGRRPEGPPFVWVDGVLLDDKQRSRFSPPDVRTEFVPVYAVQAPEWDWDRRYGPEPLLNAEELASIASDARRLRSALEPLVRGYEAWVTTREQEASRLFGKEREIALSLLQECREALERIRSGLDLLNQDDVRLAFAFACQAMHLQAKWAGRGPLIWRPFQMAFILMNLRSVVSPESEDRRICDLLWIPTGGGKTEAYLGLAAFTIAFRRRRAIQRPDGDRTGAGVSVLSRYTLRLLTIQQFRRALSMIAACELLRVQGLKEGKPVGWRPPGWGDDRDFIWGAVPFRIGLWVGGNLTPNSLQTGWKNGRPIRGALDILKGEKGEGEPAQILTCPACGALLAVPEEGLQPGKHILHLVIHRTGMTFSQLNQLLQPGSGDGFQVSLDGEPQSLPGGEHQILSLRIRTEKPLDAQALDTWWKSGPGTKLELAPFRASRPGYFPVRAPRAQRRSESREIDFEIWCPAPACPLSQEWWCEGAPAVDDPGEMRARHRAGRSSELPIQDSLTTLVKHPETERYLRCPDPLSFRHPPEPWRIHHAHRLACRIPIPALTVDEQVYRRLPSMVVATVDKFARLPFLPEAGALFGNVAFYVGGEGYARTAGAGYRSVQVKPLDPPDLILQDELHLIEGPLGSLAGLYETAIDFLCQNGDVPVKYIASTATVREASAQVQSLFNRRLRIFPPPGLYAGDRFFIRSPGEVHPLDEERPGQLYAGICAPGRGPLTPVYRIWACLLQQVHKRRHYPGSDDFWTLVGYFNAIRELAGARALYRQDIPQRIRDVCTLNARPLPDDRALELSSRVSSTNLPALLERLACSGPDTPDALFATSMFGTGVDIPRLSLMVVHGQPKTTSAYIQATGRVGRRRGALVVTFLRASRPRDLSHYEFFCGYHQQLHRYVEPVTVMPFSPGALDMALGPVMVSILRHRRDTRGSWCEEETASYMAEKREEREVASIPSLMESRAQVQPDGRRPLENEVQRLAESELDRWKNIAEQHRDLVYVEYAIQTPPRKPVVLGDPPHTHAGLPVVYENVPQSMREVEESLDLEV